MKAVFAWLGRTGLLYCILCGAVAFYIFAWPAISSGFSGESLRQDIMSVGDVRAELAADRRMAQDRLEARAEAIRGDSRKALENRLAAAKFERDIIAAQLAEDTGWFDSIRPSRILATRRLELRNAALNAEIGALEMALEARKRQTALIAAETRLREYPRIPTTQAIAAAEELCRDARADLDAFEARNRADRTLRTIFLQQRRELEAARTSRCNQADRLATFRERGLAANRSVAQARTRLDQARNWTVDRLPDPARDLDDTTIRDVLVRAALALLVILLMPFIIRTLFYYGLAPIAQNRPPIRLGVPSGTNDAPVVHGPSTPSINVTLDDEKELLVRQSFLQSSQKGADMRTRKLLDWRSPFTSLASGMAFLTQARPKQQDSGTIFGISARDDPFAEIARIDLPSGGALVLQPRALAAVVQPIERPLQIRSRWRLFSLHAWLTFQFRYLVFHGPVSLIVKGGRGVRIEPAAQGRMFGQDQLIGFSAHTAYAIRRSETFLPYLFGREPLFRDIVADDGGATNGILVIEEAPSAGRRNGIRGGLENSMDAILKAFGI